MDDLSNRVITFIRTERSKAFSVIMELISTMSIDNKDIIWSAIEKIQETRDLLNKFE